MAFDIFEGMGWEDWMRCGLQRLRTVYGGGDSSGARSRNGGLVFIRSGFLRDSTRFYQLQEASLTFVIVPPTWLYCLFRPSL